MVGLVNWLCTFRQMIGNWVHFVLQHLGMKGGDVERLHSVWEAACQHGIHVHTSRVLRKQMKSRSIKKIIKNLLLTARGIIYTYMLHMSTWGP